MRTAANEATDISPGRGGVGGGDTTGSARRRAFGLFTFFLLVIAAFWIQKPIRTSKLLTELGPEALPLVKLGTALLILPVMLIYSSLAAHYRRHTLVYWCTGTFVVTSIAFWWLLSTGAGARWTPYAFFFYVDIFNSVLVALFWSFANDLTSPEEAKRTYGVVGAGGIVGGVIGSAVTGWTVETLGAPNLLLVCAAVLVVIAALAWWLAHDAPPVERPTEPRATVREALAGARLTFSSSYLLSIAGIVVAYEVVSNVIDYQFNTAVAGRFQSDATMAAFLGRFSTASSGVSLLVQLGLTSWILHRWGPRVGLLVLPLVLGLGSAGFLFEPIFLVVAATFFGDAALGYSLNQSSKEVLYTPTDEATKYQAKAFIDMFLMRLAKAGSSLLILAAMAWWLPGSEAVHRLGVISLVAVVVWALLALRAGRGFEREAPAAEADGREARPTGPAPAAAVPRAV